MTHKCTNAHRYTHIDLLIHVHTHILKDVLLWIHLCTTLISLYVNFGHVCTVYMRYLVVKSDTTITTMTVLPVFNLKSTIHTPAGTHKLY